MIIFLLHNEKICVYAVDSRVEFARPRIRTTTHIQHRGTFTLLAFGSLS